MEAPGDGSDGGTNTSPCPPDQSMDTLRLHESESSLEVDQDIDIEIIPPALAALKKLGKADRRGSARSDVATATVPVPMPVLARERSAGSGRGLKEGSDGGTQVTSISSISSSGQRRPGSVRSGFRGVDLYEGAPGSSCGGRLPSPDSSSGVVGHSDERLVQQQQQQQQRSGASQRSGADQRRRRSDPSLRADPRSCVPCSPSETDLEGLVRRTRDFALQRKGDQANERGGDDQEARIRRLEEKISRLRQDRDLYRKEADLLREENATLSKEQRDLKRAHTQLRAQYNSAQERFDRAAGEADLLLRERQAIRADLKVSTHRARKDVDSILDELERVKHDRKAILRQLEMETARRHRTEQRLMYLEDVFGRRDRDRDRDRDFDVASLGTTASRNRRRGSHGVYNARM